MQVVSRFSVPFHTVSPTVRQQASAKPEPAQAQPVKTVEKENGVWEAGSFSWRDLVDAINPLQHIPVISTIYRKLTGDQMGYASRIAGDALFGGVVGSLVSSLVSSVINVFVDHATGKDVGEHLMAAVQPAGTSPVKRSGVPYPYTPPVVKQAINNSPATRQPEPLQAQVVQQSIAQPVTDASKAQMAINQYKWQAYADQEKTHSNFWG